MSLTACRSDTDTVPGWNELPGVAMEMPDRHL